MLPDPVHSSNEKRVLQLFKKNLFVLERAHIGNPKEFFRGISRLKNL
jgi:hypothetical protein